MNAERQERSEQIAFDFRMALAWTALDERKGGTCLWWLRRAVEGDVKPAAPARRRSRVEGRFDSAVAFENLQSALEAADCRPHVAPTGQGSSLCPAHEDRGASLRFKDDGRLLVHCNAGCTTDAVLAALNMTWSRLGGLR